MSWTQTGYNRTGEVSPSTPPSPVIEGTGGDFMVPRQGFTANGYNRTGEVGNGINASGVVTKAGGPVQGQTYVFWRGEFVGTAPFSTPLYAVPAPPPSGVTAGETTPVPEEDSKVIIETETGGLKEETFTGLTTTLDADFLPLDIEVTDVNGDPVSGATVWIDNLPLSTDADGAIAASSSGTVAVSALYTTVEKEVDVSATSAVAFQYAGIQGTVTNMDGEPIGGKTVEVLDSAGDVVLATATNEDGEYDFTEVGITDYYVQVEPYFRPVSPATEGAFNTKNFPATVLYIGDVDDPDTVTDTDLINFSLRFFDEVTGDPATKVPIRRGVWEGASDVLGYARGLSLPGESEDSVVVADNDRRYVQMSIDPAELDPSTAYHVELKRNVESSRK